MNGTQPKIDINWLGECWNILRSRMGEYIGMTLVGIVGVVVLYFILNIPLQIVFTAMVERFPGIALMALMGQQFTSFLAQGVSYVLFAGVMIFTLKLLRGETAKFEDVFAGFKNFVPYFVAGLAYGIAVGFAYCCFCIPGLILSGLLMFTFPLIYDRNMGPIDAMKESFNLLKDQLGMATVYFLLAYLFAIAGLIACGVGVIVTLPIIYIAQALAYHKIVGGNTAVFVSPSQYPRDPSTADNMPPAPEAWPSEPAPEKPVDEEPK